MADTWYINTCRCDILKNKAAKDDKSLNVVI